jgi:hypothetical protein
LKKTICIWPILAVEDASELLEAGDVLARDFVVVAVVQTLSLMVSSLLTMGHFLPFCA